MQNELMNNSERSKSKTADLEDNSCRLPKIAMIASVALAKRFF
jgi:hypothetical protein